MKMNIVPAANGKKWMTQGFALFRQHAKSIFLATFLYVLIIISFFVVSRFLLWVVGVPIIIALGVLGPALMASMVSIFRVLDRGQPVSLDVFLQPFKTRFAPLCAFGALYMLAVASVYAMGAGIFVLLVGDDSRQVLRVLVAMMNNAVTGADSEYLLRILPSLMVAYTVSELVVLLSMFPLLMAYYFAPLLIGWDKVPVGKAIVFSFVACLKNWRPFLLFSLFWMVATGMLVTVVVVFVMVFMLALPPTLGLLLAAPLYLVMGGLIIALTFAFYYMSYKDIFTPDEA
ncbi:MAG: hypothetical protein LBU53_07345 [Zoogloeaceae bacterium]|jgi:hypothetical protein|nr:hypothetical protein [Zoogloeaceae bacterium]